LPHSIPVHQRFQFILQSIESQFAERREQLTHRKLSAGCLRIIQIKIDLDIILQHYKPATHRQLVPGCLEVLAALALDLGDMRQQVVDRAILHDQLPGSLGPDSRDPGNVVDRISHQRQHIDDVLRLQSGGLKHIRSGHRQVLVHIEQLDMVAQKLREVLVLRNDSNGQIRILALQPPHDCGDRIVGLDPR
jgi:hypothetical protein